jgi:AcrR family transcriptional regulator
MGYRRALLTDVAARLGLSHALLYRYVESKEALFELALVYAADPSAVTPDAVPGVPRPTPPAGRVLDLVKRWAGDQARFPLLEAAEARDHAGDAAGELAGIIGECYEFVERNRLLLALIERSALDIPELHALYFTGFRRAYVGRLADYLQRRTGTGELRPVPDAGVAARFIIESVAWFAWHRKGDPDSDTITDEQARTVTGLLLAAFVPPEGVPRQGLASPGGQAEVAGGR